MRWAHTASEAHPLLLQVDIDVGESLQQVRDVLTRIAAADGSWLSLRVVDESRVMIWAQRRTDAADRVRKAMDQPGGI